jgi:hypothetical protein
MCNSVLSAVKSALAFEKKSELHRITSLRYRKLWVRFDDIRYAQGVPYLERQTQSQIAGQRQAWADDSGLMRKSETWAEWFKDYLDVMEMAPSISDELYDYYASKLS